VATAQWRLVHELGVNARRFLPDATRNAHLTRKRRRTTGWRSP